MRRMLLQTAAVLSWVTVIVGTFTGFDDDPHTFSELDFRIWLGVLSAALSFTLLAAVDKRVKVQQALTNAVLTRPLTRFDTGPQVPVIRQQPIPPPRLAAVDGHGGQHRKRHGPPSSPGSEPASSRAAGLDL
jgi:hypothetical protein